MLGNHVSTHVSPTPSHDFYLFQLVAKRQAPKVSVLNIDRSYFQVRVSLRSCMTVAIVSLCSDVRFSGSLVLVSTSRFA